MSTPQTPQGPDASSPQSPAKSKGARKRDGILFAVLFVAVALFVWVIGPRVAAWAEDEPEQGQASSKPKVIQDMEKTVAKALRPHKNIEVQSYPSVNAGKWEIGAEFVALRVAAASIEADMMEAYKKVYTSDAPVDRVGLIAHGELIDGYGNEVVAMVYATEMDEDVGRRINWENDWQLTPSRVMTTTYLHPILR